MSLTFVYDSLKRDRCLHSLPLSTFWHYEQQMRLKNYNFDPSGGKALTTLLRLLRTNLIHHVHL